MSSRTSLEQAEALELHSAFQSNLNLAKTMVLGYLPEYSVLPMSSIKFLGFCRSGKKVIRINEKLLASADRTLFWDVVMHEIAHGLVWWDPGHGSEWKVKAVELGAVPRAHGISGHSLNLRDGARYLLSCNKCGWTARYGSYKGKWRCAHCCGRLDVIDTVLTEAGEQSGDGR